MTNMRVSPLKACSLHIYPAMDLEARFAECSAKYLIYAVSNKLGEV